MVGKAVCGQDTNHDRAGIFYGGYGWAWMDMGLEFQGSFMRYPTFKSSHVLCCFRFSLIASLCVFSIINQG